MDRLTCSESTEAQVRAIWESVLGVSVRADDNFFELGGTSLAAIRVLVAISDRFEVDLPPSVFVGAQTPTEIAALIDGPPEPETLVPMRAGAGGRPVFLVHGIGGGILDLRELAELIDPQCPVYGVQALGMDPRSAPLATVEEMAVAYLHAIREAGHGPFTLVGYSFGGVVAYEMARRAAADGAPIDSLLLIDPTLHPASLTPLQRWRFRVVRPVRIARRVVRARGRISARPSGAGAAGRLLTPAAADERAAELSTHTSVEQACWKALRDYRPRPYDGPATLVAAREAWPLYPDPREVWPRLIPGRLTVHAMAGKHLQLLTGENLERIAWSVRAGDPVLSA
jgi:thioesterase domain-containing protein/acyl carrier protein